MMTKQNDPLTLLNLACLKHTGCLLPISDFGGNNWKYDKVEVGGQELDDLLKGVWREKKAKWSPHPYFNPLHLYYPSDDFGAQVLRSNLVDEIKFCKDPKTITTKEIVKSISNPFGYKGVKVVLQLDFGSRPAKINRLFHAEREPHDYPHFGGQWAQKDQTVIHHPDTKALDEVIFRRKMAERGKDGWSSYNYKYKYDIWTAKAALRKKKDTVDTIYLLKQLAIGMSNTSESLYFVGYHCYWSDIRREINGNYNTVEWRFKGKTYYEWIAPVLKAQPQLTPEDYIRIYNPSSIDKQEKINQALITNFPKSSHR
tara:strand:+ start:3506 stop:4444 length:939 start_codon:yes stop_codon:yes gene_type:complete